MDEKLELVVTEGTFSLDGGSWEVENNVWLLGNDRELILIDPAHDLKAIADRVAGRSVKRILFTHAHNDHIGIARQVSQEFSAPVYINPQDRQLWQLRYPDWTFDYALSQEETISIGHSQLKVLETPGHTPGSVCFYDPKLSWQGSQGVVISGDTLFKGGPGATGRSFSDFPTIIDSIRSKLLTLPEETAVLPGHGPTSSIGAEKPDLGAWIKRGY